jgi:hypothetical protein
VKELNPAVVFDRFMMEEQFGESVKTVLMLYDY